MGRATFIATTILAASGCAAGPSRLSEFRDVVLTIRTEVGIWLSVSAAGTPAEGCAELRRSPAATIDEAPMKLLTPGGSTEGKGSLLNPGVPECQPATFEATDFQPDGGVVQFVLSDESATFTTQVSAPRLVRSLRLEGGDGGTLQRSTRASLRWPFDTESLLPERTRLVLQPVDGGPWHYLQDSDLEIAGSQVGFTVPPTLPPGAVRLVAESKGLALRHCEGPSSCVLDNATGSLGSVVVQ